MEGDCSVGREVGNAMLKPRHRKPVVDQESQTEEHLNGDKPENPGVISESTQSTGTTDLQTMAQHPFNSCTAVNCLICATIGKND